MAKEKIMAPFKTCEQHPELVKLVTTVQTGLDYISRGQDEIKKTLKELKDSQQTSLLDIQSALSDAKDYTREEANKIWPSMKTLEDRLEGAIQERNLKLTEVKEQLENRIDRVHEKVNKFTWMWIGITGVLFLVEFLTRIGIIHWGTP
jgi:hypothetical protein